MTKRHAEVICIGTGGVGSAVLWNLARRGVDVIGLDRFPPAHDRGSSHGRTRVIRLAYFEHPDYVPLLRRSYELWTELEEASGRDLYRETGLLEVGPPDGEIIPGVQAAAAEHGLAIENVDSDALGSEFPGFVVPPGHEAVFEQQAGYLRVEECIATQLQLAQESGACVLTGLSVLGWEATAGGVTVDTDQGSFGADSLVIAAGAWAGDLLADLQLPLRVLRKPLFWFEADDRYAADNACPLFFFETPSGLFYGFPAVDDSGLKVAEHSGGDSVSDPLTVDRSLHESDRRAVSDFLEAHLPGVVTAQPTDHSVCMYTSTPDAHFIVDRHPDYPQVSVAAGLSGHGFKMASALGETLADLATGEVTRADLQFLAFERLLGRIDP